MGVEVILGQHDVMNGGDNWNAEMNQFVGRTARVTSLDGTDGENCLKVRVDIDGGRWVWRIRNLQLVDAAGAAPAVFVAAAYSVTQTGPEYPHLLLAADRDFVTLWDRNVGQLLARQPISQTLEGENPDCLRLESPHSAILRGDKGRIVRVDLVTGEGKPLERASCEAESIGTSAAPTWRPTAPAGFSADGKWVAATDSRGGWQAWLLGDPDADPVKVRREGLPLSSAAPGPGDFGLVAGTFDGQVLLWQSPQGPAIALSTGDHGPVYDIAVDGERARARPTPTAVCACGILQGRRLIAEAKAPQTQAQTAPTPTPEPTQSAPTPTPEPTQSAQPQTAPTETPPATAEADKTTEASTTAPPSTPPTVAPIVSVAVNAAGTLALSGGLDGSLHLWEINPDGLQWLDALPAVDGKPVWDVALSQDGSRGLSAHQNKALVVWDIRNRKEYGRLATGDRPIYAVRFDPLDIMAISGEDQGRITVWDPRSVRAMFSFDQPGGAVAALALNSDDTGLLTSDGATLYRWQLLASPPEKLQGDPGRFVLQLPCSDWQERYTLDKALWPDCLEEESQVASAPIPTPAA